MSQALVRLAKSLMSADDDLAITGKEPYRIGEQLYVDGIKIKRLINRKSIWTWLLGADGKTYKVKTRAYDFTIG